MCLCCSQKPLFTGSLTVKHPGVLLLEGIWTGVGKQNALLYNTKKWISETNFDIQISPDLPVVVEASSSSGVLDSCCQSSPPKWGFSVVHLNLKASFLACCGHEPHENTHISCFISLQISGDLSSMRGSLWCERICQEISFKWNFCLYSQLHFNWTCPLHSFTH